MIRFEDTRGKPVISRKEGANVAKFDDFQFDLRSWEIFGYRLRSVRMFGKAGGVAATELDQVGRDVVFIASQDQVEWSGGTRNPADGRAWASRYLGTRVISRDGTSLGEVEDLVFDPTSDRVLAIIITGNRIVRLEDNVATGSAAVVLESADLAVPFPEDDDHEAPSAWWSRVSQAMSRKTRDEQADPSDQP